MNKSLLAVVFVLFSVAFLLYFGPVNAQDIPSVSKDGSLGSGTHVNWAAASDRFVPMTEPDQGTATASTYDLPTRPGAGLVITPTFDSSITSDPNSAAIQAMINQAIAIYQAQFSDPITVTILFRYSANTPDGSPMGAGSLARSNYVFYNFPYNTYITQLSGDATTANDATALANLPGAALSTLLPPTSANGRAIGLNTPPAMFANSSVGAGGPYDGIVTLNAGQSFSFTRPPGASYDALRSTEHEIDEVLGLGSGIGQSSFRPQDLFSWSSAGVRNITSTGTRYFSINGGITNLVGFNQSATGDFGDWISPSCPQANPFVQNAFSCPGQFSDVTTTSPEAVNLDVIGYNLVTGPAASTFTWIGTAGDNNYQTAGNWSPARTVKSPSDILVFNNGVPTTATNFPYPGETIGQLQVLNNTVVALSTNGPNAPAAGTISRTGNTVTGVGTSFTTQLSVGDVILIQTPSSSFDVTAIASDTSLTTQQSGTFASQIYAPVSRLTISGGSGSDLVVGAGSQLNILGSAADKAIRIALLTGTTGSISGSMSFNGAAPPDGTFNRLTAADANAVTFQSGSTFTVNPSVSGNAFGSTNLNSIIFASGSTYVGTGGSNPFGAAAPNSVTVFQTGSLYRYQSSVLPAFNGRTYANFELNTNLDLGTSDISFTGPLSIDNFTVNQGILTMNFGGGFTHTINGNLVVNGGTLNIGSGTVGGDTLNLKGNILANGGSLNFNPATTGTLILNGAGTQIIGGAGNLSFNNFQNVTVNDAGLTLGKALTLPGLLTLTNGTVSTGVNTLSSGTTGTVSRTNGYVIGTLQKNYSSPGAKTFEVGTANGYSPVDVNVTTPSPGGAPFTVKCIQGAQPNVLVPGKALSRYWTLTGAALTADLTFHYLDPTDIPGTATESNFVIQKYSGGFSQPGGSVNTAANTASISGVSSFLDWTLAEPAAVSAGNVTVSGRVVTPGLTGLRNVTVQMTDSNNVVRTATTSSFGFFSFDNVATGQQYTFRVQSRLYRFAVVNVTINDTLTLPDMVGLE